MAKNDNLTSIVVGANSDIGSAICSKLLKRGDFVIALTRSSNLSKDLLSRDRLLHYSCDLLGDGEVGDFFRKNQGRKFNNLIYCAGYHKIAPVSPVSSGDLKNHLDINYLGFVEFSRFFLSGKNSDTSRQRTITAIASIAHKFGEPGLLAYSASKAALVSAAKCLASEYSSKGVRVNTVSPGWIEGGRSALVKSKISEESFENIRSEYPLGFGKPTDVADSVDFLSSEKSRWITGVDLVVDGGRSIV